PQHPVAPAFLLGLLERIRQLADHRLHAGVEVGDELREPVVCLRRLGRAAHQPEDDQQQDERSRACDYGYDGCRRHSDPALTLIPSTLLPSPPAEAAATRALVSL